MPFPIRVIDVMSRPVLTIDFGTPAAEAARRCAKEHVGSLVVVDEEGPVGIVTSSDFVALLGSSSDPRKRPVGEFMSSPLMTIQSDAPVGDAVAKMFDTGVSRLVVVDDDVHVGIVSTDDIVRHVPQVFHRYEVGSPPEGDARFRVRQETAFEKSDWEFECRAMSDESVSEGDWVSFTKTISDKDVRAFAEASGDTNRLHLDDEYAAGTRFERRIVHGTLVGGLISAALARIPGLTIYLSQDLSFLAPVDIGERVTAVCEVVESLGRDKYELTTDVVRADGEPVIEGEAAVLIDEQPSSSSVEFEVAA